MKWFKHMCDASENDFLTCLEDEFGLEGYARWFKLCEAVGRGVDPKKGKWSVAHPWSKWQAILRGKRNKLETFLKHPEVVSRTNQKQTGNILEIEIPKMRKLKDNYTKDLQASGNSPRARVSEEEGEEEYNTLPAVGQIDLLKEPEKGRDGTPVVFKVDLADGTQANVTERTIQEWEKNFRFVDVRGKVANLVEWYRSGTGVDKRLNRKNWFFAFAGMLQKSSEKAKADMVARNPGFDPNDPHGDKAARKAIEQSRESFGQAVGDKPF